MYYTHKAHLLYMHSISPLHCTLGTEYLYVRTYMVHAWYYVAVIIHFLSVRFILTILPLPCSELPTTPTGCLLSSPPLQRSSTNARYGWRSTVQLWNWPRCTDWIAMKSTRSSGRGHQSPWRLFGITW